MVPCWSLRQSTSCFPGCAISSQTVSTTAPTCVKLSPNSASGPSRSSNAPLTLPAFNCCRAAGSSNEPWLGSIETAAWQRISRRRLRAPRRGFTSPLYSSSSGDWFEHHTIYLRYNTTIPILIQTLRLGAAGRHPPTLAKHAKIVYCSIKAPLRSGRAGAGSAQMKNLLTVVGDGNAGPVLDTALMAAQRFTSHIVGLHSLTTE